MAASKGRPTTAVREEKRTRARWEKLRGELELLADAYRTGGAAPAFVAMHSLLSTVTRIVELHDASGWTGHEATLVFSPAPGDPVGGSLTLSLSTSERREPVTRTRKRATPTKRRVERP